ATGWPGGAYASNAVLGTRAVGPAAAAWSSMVALGRKGYQEIVRGVMSTTRTLQLGIVEQEVFQLVGDPDMSVFAVTSVEPAVAAIVTAMQKRNWRIDALDVPPSMHFVVFPRHEALIDEFLSDLAAAATEATATSTHSPPTSVYGVLVRGHLVTHALLRADLDARYDR
ncbi:MAG: hypothetical protein WCC38_10120, partial [Pseudonocardiaceae bacterium]